MIKIAITGGIACGKSTVANILSEMGVPVCDADDLSREALAIGSPQLRQVKETFGAAVLLPDGELDRSALATCVFNDAIARRQLERIVHPVVQDRWTGWLREREHAGCPLAAVVIPLLFEGEFTQGWDAIVCVTARRTSQIDRLVQRGLSTADAGLWIAAQMPVREKEFRSDFVIINNSSMGVLRQQVETLLKRIVEKTT